MVDRINRIRRRDRLAAAESMAWAVENPEEIAAAKKSKKRYNELVEDLLDPERPDLKHGEEGDRWLEVTVGDEAAALVMNQDGEVFLAIQDLTYPFSSSRVWLEEVNRHDFSMQPYNMKGHVCLIDYDDARESFEERDPEQTEVKHMVTELEKYFGDLITKPDPAPAVASPAKADASHN